MSDALLFVLTALGAYRLWRFVALDDLPFIEWPRERFENWVCRHFGAEWSSGVSCPWCSGWWCSCIAVGVVWYFVALPLPGLWFAAVSTVVAGLAHAIEE